MTVNGSVLAEVGAFKAEIVNLPQKHHRSRNADDTTNAPILANTCYQQPFFMSISNFKKHNKMSKRQKLEAKIEAKKAQIQKLKEEIIELRKETFLLSDKQQRFEEKEETHIVSRRPKKEETFLIGRIYWKEYFRDEDTGNVITIERNQIVRKNGEWL
ncbi:MAG: hypothetical protein MH137_11230 [Flavobacteriales bacterium]|nr:hypothetical protein [Flavobacteriales bacterium]